jgi:tRNA threonylcarbamoyl adenosine modification protein YeaZ
MSYGLAIHTSSPELGFAIDAIANEPRVMNHTASARRVQTWNLGREVSNQLHDRLLEFMTPQTWTDLAFIAVAIGPGGFTGTRLGVVLARTLAQQLQIPLFGVSSLAAIAYDPTAATAIVPVQMPAQRGEWYTAIYHGDASPIRGDAVMALEQWQVELIDRQLPSPIEAPPEQGGFAAQVLAIAQSYYQAGIRPDWATVLPYYGQHPVNH